MSSAYYEGTEHVFYSDTNTNVTIKAPEGQNLIIEATLNGPAMYPDIETRQVLYKDAFTVDGNPNFTYDNVAGTVFANSVGSASITDVRNKIYLNNVGIAYGSASNSGYHRFYINDVNYLDINTSRTEFSNYIRGVGGNSGSPSYGFSTYPQSGIFAESGNVAITCNSFTSLHTQAWEIMPDNEAACYIGSFRVFTPVKASLCIPNNSSYTNILLGCGNNITKNLMSFYNDFTNVVFGSIIANAGASVSYTTASDRRLKYDIIDLPNALQTILKLKPRKFWWDNSFTEDIGFIADEMQEVVPNAVFGNKDELNSDGSPKYQSVDQTKLIALLVGSIKELNNTIDTLKADIIKLNGDIDVLYRRII